MRTKTAMIEMYDYEGGGMIGDFRCSIALHRFKKAKIFVGQTFCNGKLTMLRLAI